MTRKIFLISILAFLSFIYFSFKIKSDPTDDAILSYIVDLKQNEIKLYWKDENNQPLKSIQNLKDYLKKDKKELLFAMNGGMYKTDNSPLGLFIKEQQELSSINTSSGKGNFYLKPNGVFYITTTGKAYVCATNEFVNNSKVKYATQSGPMLVIDGQIHTDLKEGSTNLNIRNGVGILPDGKVVFAMSKEQINFYDFAFFFKRLGCKQALYLDGFVSRTYLPEKKWIQTDGNFGVMIGVSK